MTWNPLSSQVDSVVDAPRPYPADGHQVDKLLRLRIGPEEFESSSTSKYIRSFMMDKVSNHAPTEAEFKKWLAVYIKGFRHSPLPSIGWAKDRGEKMWATKYVTVIIGCCCCCCCCCCRCCCCCCCCCCSCCWRSGCFLM